MNRAQGNQSLLLRIGQWLGITASLLVLTNCAIWPGDSLTSDQRLHGSATLHAFAPLKHPLRGHAAAVLDDSGKQLGLAMRYDASGELLCKASDMAQETRLTVEFPSGERQSVVLIGADERNDVGLLRPQEGPAFPLAGTPFRPVSWASSHAEGSWVACLQDLQTMNVGIVSGTARTIPKPRPLLGILLKPASDRPGAVIDEVIKKGAADRARLKPDDRIVALNHRPMENYRQLQSAVSRLEPGTEIVVDYERRGRIRRKTFALGDETMTEGEDRNLKMSGPVSARRAGFEEVFQHDSPVSPESMGGPVVNLQGEIMGMNIARSDRVTTFALTPQAVRRAVSRIRRGS